MTEQPIGNAIRRAREYLRQRPDQAASADDEAMQRSVPVSVEVETSPA